MQIWEYCYEEIVIPPDASINTKRIIAFEALNRKGAEGWEAITPGKPDVANHPDIIDYWYKRPKAQTPDAK